MKPLLAGAGVVLALGVGVTGLREATQNRPDVVRDGSSTVVGFTVEHRDYRRGPSAAAAALWTLCSASVDGDVSAVPEPVADGFEVHISPALGEHGRRRLVGCLQDATLDRVIGHVQHVVDA